MNHLGDYDVIVIGAGHAGIEAAHAAAVLGAKTAVFTMSLDAIGNMPCNPSIGGTAKGTLVREVDALGGVMGLAADATYLQSRMLNKGKGPAVHALRVQTDRRRYNEYMKHALEQTPGLAIHQAEVVALEVENGHVKGVITQLHGEYTAKCVVLATGTNLGGKIFVGDAWYASGPDGMHAANALTDSLKAAGLPLRRFKTGTPARVHRRSIDFSKLEPLALGKEPDWVAEQRRKDYQSFALQRKDPWSPDEDNNLIRLLKQQKYGYAELSEILRRSEGAIVRRCRDLGLKERPVRADPHRKGGSWSDEQHQILADGIRHGDSYSMIGRVIGKSEKALRGKIYFTYLTEDADKVRAMLGDGPWGHGAPEPTVRQGFSLSKTRTEVRKNLSILDALLRKRMNDLGYDPYWQRFMCANWDPVKGCSADCADCDSCTEFQRIRPQYCRMCGGEFLERKEQTYCPKCRAMRKKQAQKKYAVLHARGRY